MSQPKDDPLVVQLLESPTTILTWLDSFDGQRGMCSTCPVATFLTARVQNPQVVISRVYSGDPDNVFETKTPIWVGKLIARIDAAAKEPTTVAVVKRHVEALPRRS